MAPTHDPTTTPNPPQAGSASSAWDPSTISNIIFSAIMVFIGIIAVWQAHRAHCRSNRVLDRGDVIGIQLLSRASTTLSSDSYSVQLIPPALPSRQVAPASDNQAGNRELPSESGALVFDGEA